MDRKSENREIGRLSDETRMVERKSFSWPFFGLWSEKIGRVAMKPLPALRSLEIGLDKALPIALLEGVKRRPSGLFLVLDLTVPPVIFCHPRKGHKLHAVLGQFLTSSFVVWELIASSPQQSW